MAVSETARKNHEQLFPGHVSALKVTDPELIEVFDNFAFDEVLRCSDLDIRIRLMVQLAALISGQALSEYQVMLRRGVPLPAPGPAAPNPEDRAERGRAVQERIVGAQRVQRMYASAAQDELHFQRSLSAALATTSRGPGSTCPCESC